LCSATTRKRIGAGEHDQHLVEVGDDHVLLPAAARPGLAAREARAPRLDRFDHRVAIREGSDRNPVADDDQVGIAALLLHAAAQAALEQGPVVEADGIEAASGAQDCPGQRGVRRGADRSRQGRQMQGSFST
jgi:hypothetical protein